MVQESLTEYINRLLRAGYNQNVIRNTLINAGHSPFEVNKAIEYARQGAAGAAPEQKVISLTGKAVVIAISALIIIILLVIGGIILLSPGPKTISFSVIPAKTQIYPGEKLSFIATLSSGEERAAEATVSFALVDKRSKQTIISKQETFSMELQKSITADFTIPATAAPGDYLLETILSYEGKTEQKSAEIKIIKKETAVVPGALPQAIPGEAAGAEECPPTCDDYNRCTNDFCEKGICRHTSITPCCGNGLCESGENVMNCVDDCREREDTPEETTARARTVSQTDAESAATLCSSITRIPQADDCFSQIALSSSKSLLCENVQDAENRDRCYISFALEGDFSVCTRVKNNYMSKACYSLQKTEQLKASTSAQIV